MPGAIDDIVRTLNLSPHPEGGFYRETYRSAETMPTPRGTRNVSTAILYLLPVGSFSALHRIASDELWHFHAGDTIELFWIDPATGSHGTIDVSNENPQAVIPAGRWFGARTKPGQAGFALVGCTVAPGFDFQDFELADRRDLSSRFPALAGRIADFTR